MLKCFHTFSPVIMLEEDRQNSCAMETRDGRKRTMKVGNKFIERIACVVRACLTLAIENHKGGQISHNKGFVSPPSCLATPLYITIKQVYVKFPLPKKAFAR